MSANPPDADSLQVLADAAAASRPADLSTSASLTSLPQASGGSIPQTSGGNIATQPADAARHSAILGTSFPPMSLLHTSGGGAPQSSGGGIATQHQTGSSYFPSTPRQLWFLGTNNQQFSYQQVSYTQRVHTPVLPSHEVHARQSSHTQRTLTLVLSHLTKHTILFRTCCCHTSYKHFTHIQHDWLHMAIRQDASFAHTNCTAQRISDYTGRYLCAFALAALLHMLARTCSVISHTCCSLAHAHFSLAHVALSHMLVSRTCCSLTHAFTYMVLF
jgi:hypothetical protein